MSGLMKSRTGMKSFVREAEPNIVHCQDGPFHKKSIGEAKFLTVLCALSSSATTKTPNCLS